MSFLGNKHIVVTGGAGFLGSVVVGLLRQALCRKIVVPQKRYYHLVEMKDVQQ